MISIRDIREGLLQLILPHTCAGCGSDTLQVDSSICLECLHRLPATHYAHFNDNPVERKFIGRLPLQAASAQYYFFKQSIIRQLMHLLKYRGYIDLGVQLGQLMGEQLQESGRFNKVDMLVPLPLSPARMRKRGYN
ncbi:MAG: ComF family protein, partial [Pedobacter sp.]